MDHENFDALTRSVVTDEGTRRGVLRLLAGSALTGVASRLGLHEDAASKARKRGKGRQEHKPSGQMTADGKKHRGNKKHKGKRKNEDKEKEKPRHCPIGFRLCSDGSCQADKPGICCIDEEFCAEGCCKKRCGDGQKYCGEGLCVAGNACCPLKPLCDACEVAVCVNGEWDCRSECTGDKTCCMGVCIPPCSNGCTIDDGCGHCTKPPAGKIYCEKFDMCVAKCPAGQVFEPETCRCFPDCTEGCDADETCCHGTCVPPCANGCKLNSDCRTCNSAPPGMAYCQKNDTCVNATCPGGQHYDHAECKCRPNCPGGGANCGDGCCPGGAEYWWCDRPGTCCRAREHHEGGGLFCQCASGYSSCGNGSCCKD